MKPLSRLLIVATVGIAAGGTIWVSLNSRANAQTPPATQQKAGTFFKNVTTSTLKELTPDDFLSAMGVISDDLGLDCADCHPGAGSDNVNWVIDTPAKKTARKMIEMVATINKTNFAGAQMVTCYTCHHARQVPATTVSLDAVYSTPNQEFDDIVPSPQGRPSATKILDDYIAALGGAQKLAGVKSFVATGISVGYEGLGGNAQFTLYAQAPDRRATHIHFKDHPERGDSTWTYDGRTGWIKTPFGLLGEYQVTGNGLDGTRLEAELSFPGQIKQALTNWRVGMTRSIGDRDYDVVQGSGPRGLLATLYFDPQTHLLTRMVRYTPSPVGRVPTQIDYADYRDVNGVKFPFEITFVWLDGRWTAKLDSVKTNVPIEAAVFAKP